MEYTYTVLGAGRQGTASAYDMARWVEAKRVILIDKDLAIAERSAHRVNHLLGANVAEAARALVELVDRYDEKTGFIAMERTTGWDATIVAEMMAHGLTPRVAGGVENFIPAVQFINELRRRGFHIKEIVE